MKNLISYFLATLLLIAGCKSTDLTSLPPHNLSDIVIDDSFDYLDVWFTRIIENNDPYPSVCSLHREDGFLVGGGVLIRPDVVLTAGHVIDEGDITYISIGNEDIQVRRMVLHPRYSETSGRVQNDIGIVFLECESSYNPIKMGCVNWLHRYQNITTVGYAFSYKKYSKRGVFKYFGTLIEEPNIMKFLPHGASIWFGDSGGGVFAEFAGETYLVGIISSFGMMKMFDGTNKIKECSAVIVAEYDVWIEREVFSDTIRENI